MKKNENEKSDLRGIGFEALAKIISEMKEASFRAKQVFGWIQVTGVETFDEMLNVPAKLREKLDAEYFIGNIEKLQVRKSADGSKKYLWRMPDGGRVESVLLNDRGRKTACLSSQVGCKMGCQFCATAKLGFLRNLTAGEIVSQVIQMEKEDGKISNLVYMGMGEPLDNYDNLVKSIRILNHPEGKNIGMRKITVSTCGLVPAIARLAKEAMPITLAVSLNATNDETRTRLMPINKKHSIKYVVSAARDYEKVTGRRVTLEYVLIEGQNDSENDAHELVRLLRGMMANINLIAYNPTDAAEFQSPREDAVTAFRTILENAGNSVSQRFKRGRSIDAACGQLTGKYEKQNPKKG